jgi:Holliday junction resolvase RusA-like endonuclease
MYTLEFTIADTPKSPNVFYSTHWRTRHTHTKKWERLVWAHVWPRKPERPLERAKVTLTRHSVRKMDADNCRLSFKPIMDALVKYGVLLDDTVAVVGEPVVIQEKAPLRQKSVRVRVEEIA